VSQITFAKPVGIAKEAAMQKRLSLVLLCSALLSVLLSCGTATVPVNSIPVNGSAPVALTMTDDPPSGVSVLSFQVSLTGATLTPANGTGSAISLVGNPIQIDVTQLQALSAFLANENVPAGTYSSLSLTFANPQLVIFNTADTSLGSSCAVGSICTLTPAIDNSATVSFTSAPFPLAVSSSTPLGLLIDFHLNTVIQSDLSVNLGAANGISLSQTPATAAGQPPPFGFVTGTFLSMNASQNQFTMQTAWGKTLTVDVNSNTQLVDWPPCVAPGGLSCLTAGDAVQVQVAAVESDGSLLAASVKWLLVNQGQSVLGTVVGIVPLKLLVLASPSAAAGPAPPQGAMATVTLDNGATFAVDANGFTIPSGLVFSSTENLTFGQELQVEVDPGSWSCASSNSVPGPPPSCTFSTNSVQLEPSQISGTVSNISAPDFTLTYASYPACISTPGVSACPTYVALVQRVVDTTAQTVYQGFNPDSFSGLANNDVVSVNGWIFEDDNGLLDPAMTQPVVLVQDIRLHPGGTF
jgi:hypothetical protein